MIPEIYDYIKNDCSFCPYSTLSAAKARRKEQKNDAFGSVPSTLRMQF